MSKHRTIWILSVFLLCGGHVAAQNDPLEIEKVAGKLEQVLKVKMQGWKHNRGEPFVKNENVLLDYWYSSNRVVKISVIPHNSAAEAREALQRFVRYDREKEELKDLGDEGYAFGINASNVAFRRGRFTVYVSTIANVDDDEDARRLTAAQREARQRSEEKKWSREFVKHVATAIDLP